MWHKLTTYLDERRRNFTTNVGKSRKPRYTDLAGIKRKFLQRGGERAARKRIIVEERMRRPIRIK